MWSKTMSLPNSQENASDYLEIARNAAQAETIAAELALIEATARAEAAREASARLEAAVAALNGESPTATAIEVPTSSEVLKFDNQSAVTAERQAAADMTPEEFDAERKKRQRAKQKELDAQNPYAQLKCSGCGVTGKMTENIIQAPSGVPVRMLVCNGCGNQNII